MLVEFDNVKGNKFVEIECRTDDGSDLFRLQTVGHSGSRAVHEFRVQGIHVKTNVDGSLQLLDVVNQVRHIEHTDVIFIDGLSFEFVNVAYTAIGQLVELQLTQIHATGPMLLFHARAN